MPPNHLMQRHKNIKALQMSPIVSCNLIWAVPYSLFAGSRAIQCLDGNIQSKYCGWVEDVQHVILNKRSFLHLTRGDNCVSTLVLCQQQEQQLEELKVRCHICLPIVCLNDIEILPIVIWRVNLPVLHLYHLFSVAWFRENSLCISIKIEDLAQS